MDRRTFIGSVAGGLLAEPLAAGAQKPPMPVIGFLSPASPAQWTPYVASFHQGLTEAGYIEGKNLTLEFRWAKGHYDRLPSLAAELARRHVGVFVPSGGKSSAQAARGATSTIVTGLPDDAVEQGLVASLGRPGGNVTGISVFSVELVAKRFELLHVLVPKATVIALLVNSENASAGPYASEAQKATRSLGQELHALKARTEQEIGAAFASLAQLRANALVVAPDPFFNVRREQIVGLAARHAVSAIYDFREFVTAGGLMSYGPNLSETYRQAGIYTGKILDGAKPGDLPVLQPTNVELVINRKAAEALGIKIPDSILVRADKVIN